MLLSVQRVQGTSQEKHKANGLKSPSKIPVHGNVIFTYLCE
jgi:hypothetical protein